MKCVRLTLALAAALLAVAPAVAGATQRPAGGGLHFEECITAKQPVLDEPRTPLTGGCKLTRTVAGDGEGSAINDLFGLTASPDGRSLYAVSSTDDAVSSFTTRPLALDQCFTTDRQLRARLAQPCQLLPHSGTEDANSGLNGLNSVAVSPDGRDVYTTSVDGSIATFAHAPSGKLTYSRCITGSLEEFGSGANDPCRPIPTATNLLYGLYSGLAGPRSLTFSPDRRFVYVSVAQESGIATLARRRNGSLRFVSCVRFSSRYYYTGPSPSPCRLVIPETGPPNQSGLLAPTWIAASPDGTSLYVTASRGATIGEFRRNPRNGALAYEGCLSTANRLPRPDDPCRPVPRRSKPNVINGGIPGLREIVVTPDGTGVYGVSVYDNAVFAFARDTVTGRLSYSSCVTGERNPSRTGTGPCHTLAAATRNGDGSGLSGPRAMALSEDGRSLFVGAAGDAAIARFRITRGGGLHWVGCLTARQEAVHPCARAHAKGGGPQRLGFGGINSLAVAGHDIYAATGATASVSRFSFR
jgi:DNA-binding beta-propeller fold protein YncE